MVASIRGPAFYTAKGRSFVIAKSLRWCWDDALAGHALEYVSDDALSGQGDEAKALVAVFHALRASLIDLECIGIIGVAWPIFHYCQ